jgi:hypothetical protein
VLKKWELFIENNNDDSEARRCLKTPPSASPPLWGEGQVSAHY